MRFRFLGVGPIIQPHRTCDIAQGGEMMEPVDLSTLMPEAEAVVKAKSGDARGYETLYHLHKRNIYSLCLRRTRNVSDAEDLTQEVFLQVHRKISSFRGEAKFASWLYRVALNFVHMHARRSRLRQ